MNLFLTMNIGLWLMARPNAHDKFDWLSKRGSTLKILISSQHVR